MARPVNSLHHIGGIFYMIDIEQAKKSLSNMIDEHNALLERYKLSGGFGNWYIHVKEAITELERLQEKEEIYNYLFMVSVGYNLALVKNKDITEKQFYEIIKKHYENAITGSDGK